MPWNDLCLSLTLKQLRFAQTLQVPNPYIQFLVIYPILSQLFTYYTPAIFPWYPTFTTWRFPKIGLPPVIIHFCLGFSLTKTIQLWGYPHDYGNPNHLPTPRQTNGHVTERARRRIRIARHQRGWNASSEPPDATDATSSGLKRLMMDVATHFIPCHPISPILSPITELKSELKKIFWVHSEVVHILIESGGRIFTTKSKWSNESSSHWY